MTLLKPYLFFFGILLCSSGAFHLAFLKAPASPTAWLVAARYAAATVASAFFVPGFLHLLAGNHRFMRKVALWMMAGLIWVSAILLIGDFLYYRNAGKHVTTELTLVFHDFRAIAAMALSDYAWVLVAVSASGAGYFFLVRKFIARQDSQNPAAANLASAIMRRVGSLSLFILVSVVIFRGGFQERPIRPADAFQYLAQAEADFALNGAYTAFYTLYHRSDPPARGDAESIRLMRSLLKGPGEEFIGDHAPFFRKKNTSAKAVKKNVVVVILESWSARRVGILGDKTGATPFFDSLAGKGWLFTHAFATGRRSIAALPAAISSIPSLFGSLYITSPYEQNFQRGMGTIFREQGYATFFTYAAKAGSMGFNAFARLAGFENITTRDSFAAGTPTDGTWGVYDHVMFTRAVAEIDAAAKPFISVIYTLHPHPPFTLPPGSDFFPAQQPHAAYYNALRYSDKTLAEFFTACEKKPWFRDTVFILMADHAFESAQGYDAFRIPLLFYSPGFIPVKKDSTVASQLDVLPTLIDVLNFPSAHAAMGRSLLSGGTHFAYLDVEHAAGVVREQNGSLVALLFGAEKYEGYYDMSRDPEWRHRNTTAPFSTTEMSGLRAYIDVMGYAVVQNRIAPRAK